MAISRLQYQHESTRGLKLKHGHRKRRAMYENTRERTCTVVEVASGSSGPCMNEACTQLRSVHHLSVTHSRCACVAI